MTTTLTIRVFDPTDRTAIVDLWNAVFPDDPPYNDPAGMIERKLNTQPELFLVGVSETRIVGSVLAGFDGVRGWIHHLAVEPGFRRRGFATQLVRAAEAGLQVTGCPKLNLQVRAGNTSALAFYESLGYEIEDRVSLGKRLGEWGVD